MPPNFDIVTFGCKVNQYESSRIAELMRQKGYIRAESPQAADLVIVNSCTVTGNSDRKVKSLISRLKKDNPDVKVILCGCLTKAYPEKAREMNADEIIEGKFSNELPLSVQSERTRAFLKIQDGCNRSCAYCIIPKARGSVKSHPVADIITETQMLINAGHKEIVITGINLCAYGEDTGLSSLTDIVETVCGINGAQRVRLGSLEPDMISESDIVRLSRLPQLCPHFHLSLQSGSDSVLKRMNRLYTAAEFKKITGIIHKYFPNAALTTDIIAGFPGETEEEFAQTLTLAKEMKFAKIHAFAFSRREGTLAAEMTEQISQKIKRERVSRLTEVADNLRTKFFERLTGTVQQVLTEKNNWGHTTCYTPVKIVGGENATQVSPNCIVNVKITRAEKEFCTGEIT